MSKKDISKYHTDENITSLIAVQVIFILLLVFLNHRTYLIFILSADFAIRAFTYLPSPLAFVAKIIAKMLGFKPKPIFAAPKKFAATIGFVFSLAIAILLLIDFTKGAYALGGILAFFASLEAVFNICVGCYVYNWLIAPIVNKRNENRTERTENDRD